MRQGMMQFILLSKSRMFDSIFPKIAEYSTIIVIIIEPIETDIRVLAKILMTLSQNFVKKKLT